MKHILKKSRIEPAHIKEGEWLKEITPPKGILEGIQELMPLLGKTAERFYFNALSSFLGLYPDLYPNKLARRTTFL